MNFRLSSGPSARAFVGIGPTYADRLRDADIETVAELREAGVERAAEATEAPASRVESWFEQLN